MDNLGDRLKRVQYVLYIESLSNKISIKHVPLRGAIVRKKKNHN